MFFSIIEGTITIDNKITTNEYPKKYRISDNISGSAQPSPKQIKHLKSVGIDYLIDLKQEPHFFVTTKKGKEYSLDTWSPLQENTKFLRRETTLKYEQELCSRFKNQSIIEYAKIIGKNPYNHRIKTIKGRIKDWQLIQTEEDLAKQAGLEYLRFAITDHEFATPDELDAFLAWYRCVDPSKKIHFHCRGGVGRTSSFMIIVSMLKNRSTKTFDEYINDNIKLIAIDLRKEKKKTPALRAKYKARLKSLKLFYQYVTDPKGYCGCAKWSDWLKTHQN